MLLGILKLILVHDQDEEIDMVEAKSNEKSLVDLIAIIVVVVWAISTIVDMIPSIQYDPPVGIYPALMLVLGGVFGVRIVKGDRE